MKSRLAADFDHLDAHPTIPLALTRTYRLASTAVDSHQLGVNGLVGHLADWGLAAVGELEIEVVGTPGNSGYLIDITVLDAALRAEAVDRFRRALRAEAASGTPTDIPAILSEIAAAAAGRLPVAVASLTYRPSPYRSIAVMPLAAPSTNATALLTETFEFAASHRLHLPELSDDDNRRLFGKCNNPNGHGHNYRIEVAVAIEVGSHAFGFAQLQQIVQHEVMQRFDHKHLNLDCPEFRSVNPSVENIARVCHGLLEPAAARHGARLAHVRVWETDKTSCRYPA